MDDTKIQMDKNGDFLKEGENPKLPYRKFDEKTGCFEYCEPELRAKAKEREKRQKNTDELHKRLEGLKKHLKRKGLEDKIGKTGDSVDGTISKTDEEVAQTQKAHAKDYILRSHRQGRTIR